MFRTINLSVVDNSINISKMFRLISLLAFVAIASAEVVSPCAEDPTRECYANYIAGVAGCTPPESVPTTDSWEVASATIEMPFFRGSIVRYNTTVEGVANVEDFVLFYDTDKQITVLSYNFPSVTVYGRSEIQYHSPGSIDTVIDTAFKTVYTNVNVTAQWEGVESITIGTAKLYSYIDSAAVDMNDYPELQAAIAAEPEGIAAQTYALFQENPTVYIREQESPTGRQIVRPFWNNWLCTNLP